MKNLEQPFSEDQLITVASNSVREYSDPTKEEKKRKKKKRKKDEYSDPIPVDLHVDIFSRGVPANSVARPRFFFALEVNKELIFFSSPQPQNTDKNSSLVATRYKFSPKYFRNDTCTTALCGLVFLHSWRRKKMRVICNPATGESITLPKVKATGVGRSYLGFDPISKHYKVLCMTWSRYGTPDAHRVLTLETGKRLWRTIQDPLLPTHVALTLSCARYAEICINGVLYYQACFPGSSSEIVCFDFRFEKFSLIKLHRDMRSERELTLFNYKGKLGAHQYTDNWMHKEKSALWVLEDAGKHKWSKSICILPPILYENNKIIVGMTGTGELVFSPWYLSEPFYIFFHNIERKAYTRVKIQGFKGFKHHFTPVHTFLDFVEDIKFM